MSSPFAFLNPHPSNEGPSNYRASAITLPPLQRQNRWSGDGLDFRRPVRAAESPMSLPSTTSTSPVAEMSRRHSIIDLTNEESPVASTARPGTFGQASRGPRYPQQIIDLSADSPEATIRPPPVERQNRTANNQIEERSPEVEFLSVRRLPEPRNIRLSHAPDTPTNFGAPLDRGRRRLAERDEEDDLRITEVRQIPGAPPQPRAGAALAAARRTLYHFQVVPMMGRVAGAAGVRLGFAGGAQAGVPAGRGFQFVAPDIDFRLAGFAMNMPDDDMMDDRPETPPPPYNPPPSAPEGFTRSPQDGDELICPNCEDELCKGDSEEKKSVWIIKACGHVYCGSCARNRFITMKGRSKTKPFKSCVVEGCEKKTSSKSSMIQVYL
ncbi:hypothetical protein EG328_012000 [Venturia inaequalis]|uniref:RING-type domain-containing protein n=1 Tax=Venturia inaequalis TaxID=5025 RepID=A0A8H3V1S6_VENIN|nr:hypothetical protein EG328_012000 [Venturia inaequalis]RDI88051.1 hypothetical protein Vi05172_g2049 [Venturia inaequalis]